MLNECLNILKIKQSSFTFFYIAASATETIVKALDILFQLGVVNARDQSFTFRDKKITSVFVDVYFAVVLLKNPRYECSNEMLFLISIIEASNDNAEVFIKSFNREEKIKIKIIREKFFHVSGDYIFFFNIYMF